MSRAKGRPSTAANCALRIFDAATICIARVICAVDPIDRTRRRISRRLCMACVEGLLELPGCGLQLGREGVVELLLLGDLRQQLRLAGGEEVRQLRLALPD